MQTAQNILRHYPPPFRWLEQRALRRVAAAYVCSETVTEVLRAKRFDKVVELIPFGVNTTVFRPGRAHRFSATTPLTIGFVGRMLPGKGLEVLAEALRIVASQDWRLLVVGDGPERKTFQQTLAQYELLHRATFTGAISYDRVSEFYQKMDMLVMPTHTTKRIREQFGRVLVEAMASGVPVIGSTSGAIPEVLSDFGLVVPEGDAEALATALVRMLKDKSLRGRFSAAGRDYVEEHYSWECVADKTYELYRQVLSNANGLGRDRPLELVA
jgi:glycosyltransferase involved in cell wall biosynthesis